MAATCMMPGCAGTILPDGYCNTCGMPQGSHRTKAPVAAATKGPSGTVSRSTSSRVLSTSTRIRTASTRTGSGALSARVGGGVIEVPEVQGVSAEAAVMANPEVPERERYCGNPDCGKPVGRAKHGRPGRLTGHCPACGQWYSFEPLLTKGELVNGQYEILGAIGHGGRGWVYVGRDHNVANRPVVLKGILNAGDEGAAAEAAAEMQYLAALEHPQIVKVYNFVAHESAAYIVMEYVEGTPLDVFAKRQHHQQAETPDGPAPSATLWAEQALAYVSGALEALDYLHERDITYNDMKPDNLMAIGRTVKLIDLGAARRLDDTGSGVLATPGYYAPELPDTGPTIATDIYTIGRTLLALLVPGVDLRREFAESIPDPDAVPLFDEYESVYRLLLRATDPVPDARFASAVEMREQLIGVLREVVARDSRQPRPFQSTLFTPDNGTGAERFDWHELPLPLAAPNEPAAGFLDGLTKHDPDEAADLLVQAMNSGEVPNTIDAHFALVRARLDAEQPARADELIDALEQTEPGDWRLVWYRGLVALVSGRHEDASANFDQVCLAFPGEPAAKIALAAAAEQAGDLRRATVLYDIVSTVDPSYTVASFALARCLASVEKRSDAVQAYERVPSTSHVRLNARIAAARLHAGYIGTASQPVTADDLVAAASIVDSLLITASQRAELRRDVLLAALDGIERHKVHYSTTATVFGEPLIEAKIRRGLERSYRELARYAAHDDDRVELIDLANDYRPWSVH